MSQLRAPKITDDCELLTCSKEKKNEWPLIEKLEPRRLLLLLFYPSTCHSLFQHHSNELEGRIVSAESRSPIINCTHSASNFPLSPASFFFFRGSIRKYRQVSPLSVVLISHCFFFLPSLSIVIIGGVFFFSSSSNSPLFIIYRGVAWGGGWMRIRLSSDVLIK